MAHEKITEALKSTELFSHFNEDKLQRLAELGEFCEMHPDAVVFREGDVGDILYLILQGRVKVTTAADPDKVFVLADGDVMGEIGLLDGLARTATVITETPCQLFRLGRAQLQAFLDLEPGLAMTLMRVMNRKLRGTLGREKELNASLRKANAELERLNSTLEHLVEQKTQQLQLAVEDLRAMVDRDPLTGVYNRRKFDGLLEEVVKQREQISLIMLDVDHFKRLNDNHGHQVGDRVLMQVAAVSEDCLGEMQYLARYGGEEFGIILKGVGKEEAVRIAEAVRETIESHHFPIRDCRPGYVCASLGVATYPDQAQDISGLIEAADKALYRAKENGRNRVEAAI